MNTRFSRKKKKLVIVCDYEELDAFFKCVQGVQVYFEQTCTPAQHQSCFTLKQTTVLKREE